MPSPSSSIPSTAYAVALSGFHHKKMVYHLEAGLRTNNLFDPYPEEVNRRLISQLATLNFAPTENSKKNLDKSKVNGDILLLNCSRDVEKLLMVKKLI